ncbi:hypothetical protein ACI68E_000933 [Malassezia pachydermatis]|uniref:Putative secretory lipase (Family 3) n=1 Tax=Malassezia pachydermatis TaxID=77020 RepID=A0A0M9VQF8_9BASI|nr:putative secretory lipase (family 3) [Malassezia pachydermatis]KOS15449.1 putative secretory lipase (family 3) [Malassezia pachydermatis]
MSPLKIVLFLWVAVVAHLVHARAIGVMPPQVKRDLPGWPSSTAAPQPVPDPVSMYQQFAGLAQESNCVNYKINMTIGDAKLLYSWGDGDHDQRLQLFHSKSLGIVASWSGMNQSSLTSLLSAADLFLVDPNRDLFPMVLPGTKVFQGFQSAYERVASRLLEKLDYYQNMYDEDRVSFTGLSYGAALSALAVQHVDANLKRGSVYKTVVFGLPRIGNREWANSLDKHMKGRFYYVVNGPDLVPHMPPREWGYQQPSGQIWINPANSTHWKFYPGQENVHGADSVLAFNIPDHTGVYFNTEIASYWGHCPATIGQDGGKSS